MTTDYWTQIEELMAQASALPEGPSKVMLHEEAVRLADAHGDAMLGYEARQELIRSATFSGYPEKALVAFTWCLAHCDKSGEGCLSHTMLWKYKWVANNLSSFPQIPRARLEEVFEDMTARYEKAGASLRAVHKLRCSAAMRMGEPETARRFYRLWDGTPSDTSTDCAACERNHQVKFHFFEGRFDDGLECAAPILDGRLRCAEIPHETLARVLMPLVRLGRLEQAMECHRRGLRLVAGNRSFLREHGMHVTFLTITDNLARAVRLLERSLPWAVESADLDRRFDFYRCARFLMSRLEESGKETVRLRLPESLPIRHDDGRCATAELGAWFEKELEELGARFDARNGTDAYRRRTEESRAWKDLVQPFPVPAGNAAEED